MTVVDTGRGRATLCHFPLMDYESKYIIHGHVHTRAEKLPYWELLKNNEFALNAGVDINGFKPVLIDELIVNNHQFKQEH